MKNSDEDAISAIASVMLWLRMRSHLTYLVVGECDRFCDVVVENAIALNLCCGELGGRSLLLAF
ncbi:hypothetical protein H6F61_16765 [Cyanobacteria bacterium FACHB-472]|nr:hypothetical protein [Cyanobacteria bacterium FACHB-472]